MEREVSSVDKNLHRQIKVIGTSLLAIGLVVGTVKSLPAMNLSKEIRGRKFHPKMESVLGMLAEKYSKDRMAAQSFARKRKVLFEDEQVTVILVPPVGEEASIIDKAGLIFYGATIEASSRHLLRVKVPVSSLEKVADKVRGISYIRLPYKHEPGLGKVAVNPTITPSQTVTSEGVSLIGASSYHEEGYEGQSTRVAVIDAGFSGWKVAQNAGELPSNITTQDFTETGLETGSEHGSNVAEILYDMAPQAELYLIKIADEVDLENAKDYCIEQGINIVNHSWVWYNTNFTDGTGLICDIANNARSHDILWVNAAGNAVKHHYQGLFTDVDNDGWHEFSVAPIDETNTIFTSGGTVNIYLTWNCWPTTDEDYDLYLMDADGNIVARSENAQTGTQPPTEAISVDLPAGTYGIAVKEVHTSQDQQLKIFAGEDLEYITPSHSLFAPADATGVIAVAAIDQAHWTTGPQEDYSSQGPTNDGRIKPDISGPTRVTTFSSGPTAFWGTSAATPHVAGAASLLLSRYPGYTADQLQSTLENWAIDMGAPGKDNIYGYGRLLLKLIPNAPPSLSWTGETNYTSDGLDPETGTSSTNFTYRVKYSDEDNDPPASGFPKVHILKGGSEISGSPFSMNEVDSADTAYSDGKLYTYTKSGLIPGTDYGYYFEAEDSHGSQATGDPINVVDGPDISEEIPVLEVDPASLTFGEVEVPQTKAMTFRAYNTGTGTLSGTISDDRDWITVDPTSFTGNDNSISVTVDTGIMSAERWKQYTGTVTVTSNGGTKTVSVSVTPTCVKVYPNPFNPGHSGLTFWGSGVRYAKIKIYTVSGELVKTIYETDGEDKVYWDGKDEEGKLVVTGIYLFVAKNPKKRDTGKFMVIRKP